MELTKLNMAHKSFRKNLKKKERHTNQHSIDGLPNKNGMQVATNQALGNPQHLQSFNNN